MNSWPTVKINTNISKGKTSCRSRVLADNDDEDFYIHIYFYQEILSSKTKHTRYKKLKTLYESPEVII